MFPAILTSAPPIPLTRPRAVQGEVRPVKRSVTMARGTRTLPSWSRAFTTGVRANHAAPIDVRRPSSASMRPRMHGGRTERRAARAVSSTRPRTASGARARDVSPHPRTHRAWAVSASLTVSLSWARPGGTGWARTGAFPTQSPWAAWVWQSHTSATQTDQAREKSEQAQVKAGKGESQLIPPPPSP